MCMVRPRSSANCRNGRSATPSIIAGLDPGSAVFLDLRIGEGRNVGAAVIAAIPTHGLADRLRIVPGGLPTQILVRAVAVELQPMVLVRSVGVAFDLDVAAAPQPDHVPHDLADIL